MSGVFIYFLFDAIGIEVINKGVAFILLHAYYSLMLLSCLSAIQMMWNKRTYRWTILATRCKNSVAWINAIFNNSFFPRVLNALCADLNTERPHADINLCTNCLQTKNWEKSLYQNYARSIMEACVTIV